MGSDVPSGAGQRRRRRRRHRVLVDEAQDALDSLLQHRLVMYIDGDYVAVGRARG